MPTKKQYNLVNDDAYDSRIPLHSEEAFHHGITFHVKYIGSLDVVRPSSRVEIVAAMRRVRYEFKAKAIKKRKVIIDVSVDGVKINMRKKKKKNDRYYDDKILLMHHPVYRIFYVSHDSQDLKIFSYIARDGSSNVFKCNVFKSKRKSQALRIVRTVGQAFEVCHKLSIAQNSHNEEEKQEDLESERSQETSNDTAKKLKPTSDRVSEPNSCDTQTEEISNETPAMPTLPPSAEAQPQRPIKHELVPITNAIEINSRNSTVDCGELYTSPGNEALINIDTSTPLSNSISNYHELQLVKQQLEQQKQQTQVAASQARLLRDQLQAESAARIESQARTHQLLIANNDLLEHIQNLVKQLQEFELKIGQQNKDQEKTSSNKDTVSLSSQPIQIYCDAATPSSTGLMLPNDLQELESSHPHQQEHLAGMYENRNNINMLGVNTGVMFDSNLQSNVRTPKSLDNVSVSSLSSCAFSRSPSFRMSTSPNIMSEDAHHLIPNMLPTSNQNYLRVNSIPVNSISPTMNQPGLAENNPRISNHMTSDNSRNHLQMSNDQPRQNYLQTPNAISPSFMQAAPFKHKVSRHSSSDDTLLMHQNSNEQDSINRYQPHMPTSRTVPTMNSTFLENVTADIGRSYGRQYSINLQSQQNHQQNMTSNFADLSVNESHDSPKTRTFVESNVKNVESTSPRYNHVNSEDELTRSSSFRKSFHKK